MDERVKQKEILKFFVTCWHYLAAINKEREEEKKKHHKTIHKLARNLFNLNDKIDVELCIIILFVSSSFMCHTRTHTRLIIKQIKQLN